jgi:uncharacterized integral membrane protein
MARRRHDQPEGASDPGPEDERTGLAGRRRERATEGPLSEQTRGEEDITEEEGAGAGGADVDQRSVPTSVRATQAAVLLLAVLFGVFALVNSQPVDFSWVFGETQVERDTAGEVASGGVPLIVLMLVSFILGAVLGAWWDNAARRARQRHDAEAR